MRIRAPSDRRRRGERKIPTSRRPAGRRKRPRTVTTRKQDTTKEPPVTPIPNTHGTLARRATSLQMLGHRRLENREPIMRGNIRRHGQGRDPVRLVRFDLAAMNMIRRRCVYRALPLHARTQASEKPACSIAAVGGLASVWYICFRFAVLVKACELVKGTRAVDC